MAATSDAPREIALTIREATAADLSAIVAMLADDPLGRKRESPDDLAPYREAFAAVETDPNQLLVVAEREGAVVGTVQLSFLPGLSRRGALRAQIEAVCAGISVQSRRRAPHTVGDRYRPRTRGRAGAADLGREQDRRASVLPAAGLRTDARGLQAHFVTHNWAAGAPARAAPACERTGLGGTGLRACQCGRCRGAGAPALGGTGPRAHRLEVA